MKSRGALSKVHFTRDKFTGRRSCLKMYWRKEDFVIEYYAKTPFI
jgi:hypothetical protein